MNIMSDSYSRFLSLMRHLPKKPVNPIFEGPFSSKDLLVDANVDCIKFFNPYKIYNDNGAFFANIIHEKSTWQILSNFLPINKANAKSFKIVDVENNVLASVKQLHNIWQKRFQIHDKEGKLVCIICPEKNARKFSFNVINTSEMHVAKISGNPSGSNFIMRDVYKHVIAIVHKKDIHDTFYSTDVAKMFDKNILLAIGVCVGLATSAYN